MEEPVQAEELNVEIDPFVFIKVEPLDIRYKDQNEIANEFESTVFSEKLDTPFRREFNVNGCLKRRSTLETSIQNEISNEDYDTMTQKYRDYSYRRCIPSIKQQTWLKRLFKKLIWRLFIYPKKTPIAEASNVDLEKDISRSNNGVTPGMGRITGSASIETLVRVGIEKEHGLSPDSKMVVLHDFTPCVDDELEVKRGQIVNILYRENDWVYVIGLDTRQEGFIPYSYCTPYNNHLAELAIKKKLPRDEHVASGECLESNQDCDGAGADTSDCDSLGKKHRAGAASPISIHSEPDMIPFAKDPSGRYIVLYTFIARDENDVSVERGEFVTVLNREDPDWYWIVRSDGQEGFIPSGFVYPADNVIQGHLNSTTQTGNGAFSNQNNNSLATSTADDLRYHGTELVMLYDYKAQAPDDLTVRRGDWIYADLNNQTVDGWLWAYAPKTRKYGFIPKAYARPPAMTSL